jgi:bifunctional ADP-heptose synthase (sugar kinase/adenylyltransferase)
MAGNVDSNLRAFGLHVSLLANAEKIVKTRWIDTITGQHTGIREDIEPKLSPISGNVPGINDFDAVVFSDYNKGFVTEDFIVKIRKEYNGPIFIDTKKKDLQKFEGCYVKVNSTEYAAATSYPTDLIVTLGKDGARYNGTVYPAPYVQVHDVCGAGDTFLSALVAEFLRTGSIEEAIPFANVAASISVKHSGVYCLSSKDITEIYETLRNA